MLIAISQRTVKIEKLGNMDALENNYVRYFEGFGVTLLPIPNISKDIMKYFEKFDIKAIILTGGNDVNPKLYGREAANLDISEDRDKTEKSLIEIAIEKKLPLFGICRGTQFINVFFGGALVNYIKNDTGFSHVSVNHKVKILDEKANEFFNKKELRVNSYHAHGITKNTLSPKLKSFAISEDGVIEGIYHPKLPIAGIQWHPERENSDKESDKKLISAFLSNKFFWNK